jgi:hypothetical protein
MGDVHEGNALIWQAYWWCWCWPNWQACRACKGKVDWIQDQEVMLREGLQLSWKRMPCANTYSYALARLDSQQVNAALAAWFVRKEARSAGVERNRAGNFPVKRAACPSGH